MYEHVVGIRVLSNWQKIAFHYSSQDVYWLTYEHVVQTRVG